MRPEDSAPETHNVVTPAPKVVTFKHPAAEGVIELLEDWLEEARAGSIRGIVLVAIHQNNEVEADFDGVANGLQAVGALEYAKREILDALLPEAE